MNNSKEKGYFDKVLAFDVETSGLHLGTANPCVDLKTGKYYQIVAIGLIVADTKTLKPIDKLYLEIKWDGESVWSTQAEKVHGLSKEYLEKNGMEDIEALAAIIAFIRKYWDANAEFSKDRLVNCMGHNIASFDICFLRYLFEKYEVPMFSVSHRFIDTNTIGWATMGTTTSDKLFEALGINRDDHNALEDAMSSLETARRVRKICELMNFKEVFESL